MPIVVLKLFKNPSDFWMDSVETIQGSHDQSVNKENIDQNTLVNQKTHFDA